MYRGPRKCDAGFKDPGARLLGCGRRATEFVHGWDLAFCLKHAAYAIECRLQLNEYLDRVASERVPA